MDTPVSGSPADRRTTTLVLGRAEIRRVLPLGDCIAAVEDAFRQHAMGRTIAPRVLGAEVDAGGFHVKTAGLRETASGSRPLFVTKVNANFPDNPRHCGLPTIQGVIALFDAVNGRPLALLDSIEITTLRTAAATAVAASHLARDDARSVTVCGCGEQGRSQLRALACMRSLRGVKAFDVDPRPPTGSSLTSWTSAPASAISTTRSPLASCTA